MDQVVRKLSSGDSIWSTCGLGKTVRERLAEIAQVEAERIATVYLEAMEADRDVNPDDRSRVRAADAFLAQAFGRPPLSIEVDKETEETIIIASPILSRLKGRRRQSGGSSRRACRCLPAPSTRLREAWLAGSGRGARVPRSPRGSARRQRARTSTGCRTACRRPAEPRAHRARASRPGNAASAPSSASIRSRRFHFAVRSERVVEPTLI